MIQKLAPILVALACLGVLVYLVWRNQPTENRTAKAISLLQWACSQNNGSHVIRYGYNRLDFYCTVIFQTEKVK